MPEQVERADPRISINKLGEYLIATPSRRRAIIKEQKRPKAYMTAYYEEAEAAITEYIVTGLIEDGALESRAAEISARPARSEWDEHRKSLCAEALDGP